MTNPYTRIARLRSAEDFRGYIEKLKRLAAEFDREIATPEEARAMLTLKGLNRVNF